MRPAPRDDTLDTDWLTRAVGIVDEWENTHQRRLLGTTDAGQLARLIAGALEEAYALGRRAASDADSTDRA
jgi:hypothetical protein